MAVIDDAITSYVKSLGVSEYEFLKDIQQMEEDGLSREEILAAIIALNVATYFVEDLGVSAGINAYMAATESLLGDLPFFGATSEAKLLALQNVQRSNIVRLSGTIGESVRMSISQGIANRLNVDDISALIRRNLGRDVPRVDTIITSTLGTYQQSVKDDQQQQAWFLG